jgi:hypothetical protein
LGEASEHRRGALKIIACIKDEHSVRHIRSYVESGDSRSQASTSWNHRRESIRICMRDYFLLQLTHACNLPLDLDEESIIRFFRVCDRTLHDCGGQSI